MRKLRSRERPVSAAGVLSEQRHWGSARVGKDGSSRVPDVTRAHPNTGEMRTDVLVLRVILGQFVDCKGGRKALGEISIEVAKAAVAAHITLRGRFRDVSECLDTFWVRKEVSVANTQA